MEERFLGAGTPESARRHAVRLGEVQVVTFDLDQPFAGAIGLLEPHERERANRFAFERDRRRFVVAHASLRLALGACLNRAPESLRFVASSNGKPRVVDSLVDLRFNLSHSGERAVLAIALNQEVGIDIEEERLVEVLDIAEHFFSRCEVDALRAVASTERVAAFFRCWTRKEAFLKALGEGLSFPLDAFEVSVEDDASDQLLRGCTAAADALSSWRVVSVPIDRPYTAAVAAGPGNWRLRLWTALPLSRCSFESSL
jgi:4'-phosphopantetheinyl transferase